MLRFCQRLPFHCSKIVGKIDTATIMAVETPALAPNPIFLIISGILFPQLVRAQLNLYEGNLPEWPNETPSLTDECNEHADRCSVLGIAVHSVRDQNSRDNLVACSSDASPDDGSNIPLI